MRWPISPSQLTKRAGLQGRYEVFYRYPGAAYTSAGRTNNYASAQRDARVYRKRGARVRIVFTTERCVMEGGPLASKRAAQKRRGR